MKRTRAIHRVVSVLTAGLLLAMVLPAVPASAVEPPLDVVSQQVFAAGAVPGGDFGQAVSIAGDTAIVGHPDAKAADVLRRRGGMWFFEAKLVPSDVSSSEGFGHSVAILGDTVVVGAPYDDELGYDAGKVYVFTRTGVGWAPRATLTANDGGPFVELGTSLALHGSTVLAGSCGFSDQGSVYVFTGSGGTWSQQAKLSASDGAANDLFGHSIALEGDTALIGAGNDDNYRGSAYFFARSGTSWSSGIKLTLESRQDYDYFGNSVALSGGTALIGAYGEDDRRGAVYVYTRSGSSWERRQRLTGSDRTADDCFGASVALAGGAAVVGAYERAGWQGAAYLFTGGGNAWTERHRFADALGEPGDVLGMAVAVSGGTALVGARWDDTPAGADAGSAWFLSFNHPLTPGVVRIAGANRYLTAVAASKRGFPAGAPAVVVATGTNWPDALGGSALAGASHGPLLLTKKDGLPSEVTAEIRRLGAVKAYVLGSTAAVGSGVEGALVSMLGRANVMRLGGANRYETAFKVAEETRRLRAFTYGGTVFVATGRNYPDATAASPVAALLGAPVVLANPASPAVVLPAGTLKAVILGSAAAVPAAIETDLVNRLGRPNVYRQGGANRYDTAAQLAFLATFFGVVPNGVGIATGENFPDALSAGPMLATHRSPLLLTRPTVLPGETKASLSAAAPQIGSMFIFGDTNAVSAAVEAQARTAAGL